MRGRPNKPTLLALGVISAVLWAAAFGFHVLHRSSILDDAFITLHLASNVVEVGSARFAPTTNSSALLSSSPLRLVLLVVEKALACATYECSRSEFAARWALALCGPLSGLVFLPFLWRQPGPWLLGVAVTAALSLAYDSAVQMEALLVFWTLYSYYLLSDELPGRPAVAGALLGIAALGRIEYAVALVGPATVSLGLPWNRDARVRLRRAAASAAAVTGAWGLCAVGLGVWPIPVSWLSKITTGQQRLFGPRFWEALPGFLSGGLFGAYSANAHIALGAVLGTSLAVCAYLAWTNRRFCWSALAIHATALLLLLTAPGGYIWYYESYVVGVAAVVLAFFVRCSDLPDARRIAGRVAAALALVVLVAPRVGFDPPFPWNFRDPESRAATYLALGQRHLGNGVFRYTNDLPPAHIRVCEIGMIAYFSGPSVWLGDVCGLAQPGELVRAGSTFSRLLSRAFPRSSLQTINGEYGEIRRMTGSPLEPRTIYAIDSGPEALREATRRCARVPKELRICLAPNPGLREHEQGH